MCPFQMSSFKWKAHKHSKNNTYVLPNSALIKNLEIYSYFNLQYAILKCVHPPTFSNQNLKE